MHRTPFNGSVPRILLVDDNPRDLQLMGEAFADCGMSVRLRLAHGAEQALAALADPEGRPDLLMLDLNMPKMDGRALLARIAEHPEWANIRTVVLTSSSRAADMQFCSELGALSYYVKPSTWDDYLALTRSLKIHFCQPA
ncbi:MAG: response regulator [Planctomycetes bacterium]|nr:response regulator [Planctomycetota bacterium]